MDQETLLTLNLIKKFLKKEGKFESSYHTPYSDNDFPIEVIFKYRIKKVMQLQSLNMKGLFMRKSTKYYKVLMVSLKLDIV
jgi:hypothetical protein